jgi:hypothetical protein
VSNEQTVLAALANSATRTLSNIFSRGRVAKPLEPIAKPQKWGAEPMGQDVRAGHKTSSVAALAASIIVHCQLSIVNFFEFCNWLCQLSIS